MHTLSKEQQQTLVEIVNEQFGVDLEYNDFVDVLLAMFEDVAGFETMPATKAETLIKTLWRNYHGQETC
ncbi:MAG: hypothetical protein WBW94_10645 [Anaerolineales bacterium]